jgi:uncharacterized protein (TIGR03083 family)
MTTPRSAAQIAALLSAEREVLIGSLAGLSHEQMTSRPVIGAWTVKDLLGHVTAWHKLALDALAAWQEGRGPPPFAGLDEFNAEQAELRRDWTLERVREEFEEAHATLVGAVAGLSPRALAEKRMFIGDDPRSLRQTLGRLLWGVQGQFRHASEHAHQIRRWREGGRATGA